MSFHPVIRDSNDATFDIRPLVAFKTRSEAEARSLRVFSAHVLGGSYQYKRGDKLVIVEINDDGQNSQQVVAVFDPATQRWNDAQ
jgi:hypothetical protein